MSDSATDIAKDVADIGRIDAVATMLRVLCDTTGMGFAAVARVSEGTWTACAVQDDIAFGLKPGGQLDIHTTLCKEVRATRTPVVIEQASSDACYRDHHTPKIFGIESYVSVPITLSDGEYFGNLCAIDPRPAKLAEPRIVATFKLFAQLIGLQLENERKRERAHKALLDEREVGELREQFIAVLGHDLRNPLAAIVACGRVLAAKADEPQLVANMAARINNNGRRMSELIDDVLDFARGRLGGGIAVRREAVADLGAALRSVVAELQDANADRVIESQVAIDRPVSSDRPRLQQLVSNLLGNALAHGAIDQPVRLNATADAEALTIDVWNGGEPIAAANLARIFAPFWRSSTSARREGLGLGLYICDQIVKAHGGTLAVASSREDGTRFTARLPLAPTNAATGDGRRASESIPA
jgi:signal transduction histidine kinase